MFILCLLFDFYLPSYNVCIEFQGEQHYKIDFHMQVGKLSKEEATKALLLQQRRDQIKRNYCKEHTIALLEIKYDQDVSNTLSDFLHYFK